MNKPSKLSKSIVQKQSKKLFVEIAALINTSKEKLVQHINQELTLLNWNIGKHIDETLAQLDEHYGLAIVATLSPLLMQQFGKGYTTSSLHRVRRFYTAFPKIKIVATVSPLLSWSHFVELTNVKNNTARNYYMQLCQIEHWNVRELRDRINSMLFERTALSKKPEKLITQELKQLQKQKTFTENIVFRDDYLLDFLGLKDTYSEKDLETSILVELQKFII